MDLNQRILSKLQYLHLTMMRREVDRLIQSQDSQSSVLYSREQSDPRLLEQAMQQRNYLYKQTDQLIKKMINEKSDIDNPFVLINNIVLAKDKKIHQLEKNNMILAERLRNTELEGCYKGTEQKEKFISDSDSSSYTQPYGAQNEKRAFQQVLKRKDTKQIKKQQFSTRMATFLSSVLNFLAAQLSKGQKTVEIPEDQYRTLLNVVKNGFAQQYGLAGAYKNSHFEPVPQEQEYMVSKRQLQQIKQASHQRKFQEIFKKLDMTEEWQQFMKLQKQKQPIIVRQIQRIRTLQAQAAQKKVSQDIQDSFLTMAQQEKKVWKKMQLRLKQFRIFMHALKITGEQLQDFEKVIKEKQAIVMARLIQVQAKQSVADSMFKAFDRQKMTMSQPLLDFIKEYCNYFFKKLAAIFLQRQVPVDKILRKSLITEQLRNDLKAMDLNAALQNIKRSVDKIFNRMDKHSIFWNYDIMRIKHHGNKINKSSSRLL